MEIKNLTDKEDDELFSYSFEHKGNTIVSNESTIYFFGDEVYKIFNRSFKRTYEENIEYLSHLNSNYVVVPRSKIYYKNRYVGFTMDNAGESIDKYILNHSVNTKDLINICLQMKDIVLYLKSIGLLHGDLSFKNFLIDKKKKVRLADINGMVIETEIPHFSLIYKYWNDFYKKLDLNANLVLDQFMCNYLSFILLNFDISDSIIYSNRDNVLYFKFLLRLFGKSNNNSFDNNIFLQESTILQNKETDINILKKRIHNDLFLVDYLK